MHGDCIGVRRYQHNTGSTHPAVRPHPTPPLRTEPQQEPLESTTAATVSFEEKSRRNSARVEKEALR